MLAAAVPAAASAQAAATAEEAIAAQQEMVRGAIRRDCRGDGGEEILICARREEDSRYRLAPLAEAGPAPAASRAGGEQLDAMRVGSERCSPVGPFVQCTGTLDVIGIGFTVVRAVTRAIERAQDD